MRKLIALFLLFFATPALAQVNYTTYVGSGATPCITCPLTPITTGTVQSINFDWGSGYVLDTGRTERVIVKFTGFITIPGTGPQTITFYNSSDDGFILTLDGTTVISNWREQGPGFYNSAGTATVTGGSVIPFVVWYYENGGGAVARLYWNYGGSINIIDAQYYTIAPPPKVFGDGGASLPQTTIKQSQQTKIAAAQQAALSSSSIYINNQGNSNSVTIEQVSTNNIIRGVDGAQRALINGSSNTISVLQGTSGYGANVLDFSLTGTGNSVSITQRNNNNYIESTINGNTNNVTLSQYQANKSIFSNIQGSSNFVNVLQQGDASHYLEMTLLSSGNNVTVNQAGNYQKLFSLTINSPNVGVTINQLNALQPDSAAMSITCTTGDCTGYSYTKN